MRCAPLLHVPRQLLSEAPALRALRAARLLRRLLPQADALHRVTALLRVRRLLPQAQLHSPPALLAGLVLVRGATTVGGPQVNHRVRAIRDDTFPALVIGYRSIAVNPACSKWKSEVKTSVDPNSSIMSMVEQSTSPQVLSDR